MVYTNIIRTFAPELRNKVRTIKIHKAMSTKSKNMMREVMLLMWQFIRQNGLPQSEALKTAWRNVKLRKAMTQRIVKFVFQKVDNSLRIAYGTLKSDIVPATGDSGRKSNPTLQVYYDTEKTAWRCFKRAQLLEIY